MITNKFEEEEDGPAWYVEKQVDRCLGGIATTDLHFIIKNAEDDFGDFVKHCWKYSGKSYKEAHSEDEEENAGIAEGRACNHVYMRLKDVSAIQSLRNGEDIESEMEAASNDTDEEESPSEESASE